MKKTDPLWRPLEERIAVVRYLMEVGPDCGTVEIILLEIIEAFGCGEILKGKVAPLPTDYPEPYSDGDSGYSYGCSASLIKQVNRCLAENMWVQPAKEI